MNKAKKSFSRSTILRKILIIFVLLSVIPVAFSSLLTISTYQSILTNLQEERGVSFEQEATILRQNILIQMALILFLLIILVLFLSTLVARSITRPLSSLVEGAKRITKGDLNIRFNLKSDNEIEELADSFNDMVDELKKQRDREEMVSKLKTEFISIAAHQLRTPLSSVKWILKMLLEGDFGSINQQQEEFVKRADLANERMIQLVNDLLNVTHIEEGKFGFEFKKVDFPLFLKETVHSFEPQAQAKGIDLSLKIGNVPAVFVFDPRRMRMALSNLIDNAINYTLSGGTILVEAFLRRDYVCVRIKDNGVGIPESQKGRVFSKFFRADNVIRLQTEGTGLGLFLAKNIIESHGGKIWFESTEGEGTSFYFTLPYKKELLPSSFGQISGLVGRS